jgi:hypothetical protein
MGCPQCRVIEHLNGNKECIEVKMGNYLGGCHGKFNISMPVDFIILAKIIAMRFLDSSITVSLSKA